MASQLAPQYDAFIEMSSRAVKPFTMLVKFCERYEAEFSSPLTNPSGLVSAFSICAT
jgi:hypothetical protein